MSSTTKFNQFNEDYKFKNRSDDSRYCMRKSKKFESSKPRGCGYQCTRDDDNYSVSDEEDSKPCCGYPDNTKCKYFISTPNKDCCGCRTKGYEENDKPKCSKRHKNDSLTKNEEKIIKLKEKLRCACHRTNDENVTSRKNKSDKRVISIYSKLGPHGSPLSNKPTKRASKCKKKSKCENDSIDVIKICRNTNEGDNRSDSTEDDNDSDSESSFYATRPDNYRRFLGPTIDETVLVCLDLFTNIAMKINMFHCFCTVTPNCRRKCMKPIKKELEQNYSSSVLSDL